MDGPSPISSAARPVSWPAVQAPRAKAEAPPENHPIEAPLPHFPYLHLLGEKGRHVDVRA